MPVNVEQNIKLEVSTTTEIEAKLVNAKAQGLMEVATVFETFGITPPKIDSIKHLQTSEEDPYGNYVDVVGKWEQTTEKGSKSVQVFETGSEDGITHRIISFEFRPTGFPNENVKAYFLVTYKNYQDPLNFESNTKQLEITFATKDSPEVGYHLRILENELGSNKIDFDKILLEMGATMKTESPELPKSY